MASTTADPIVVAEKDSPVAELARHFLEQVGYSSVCLSDGYSALDYARAKPPPLIITEILLPRLDGLAFCRLVKSDPALRNTKVMIVSVVAAKEKALAAGADTFLEKPLEKREFIGAVRALIGEPKAAHE